MLAQQQSLLIVAIAKSTSVDSLKDLGGSQQTYFNGTNLLAQSCPNFGYQIHIFLHLKNKRLNSNTNYSYLS